MIKPNAEYSLQIEVKFDKFSRCDRCAVERRSGKTNRPRGKYCTPGQTVGQPANRANSANVPFRVDIRTSVIFFHIHVVINIAAKLLDIGEKRPPGAAIFAAL